MDPSPLPAAVSSIASQGVLGVLLVIVGWVAWAKDRELKAERLARVADAKDYNRLAMDLQARVIDTVHKLSGILDEVKKYARPAGGG